MTSSKSLNIVITWEMGAGYGHLLRLRVIAKRLHENGHRVFMATRDIRSTREVLPEFPCFQAPSLPGEASYPYANSLAEIMHNIGCDSPDAIERIECAWLALAGFIRPDAVVMDFSPLALLSFQGHPARRILIDNGYSHPTDTPWTPPLRPWQSFYRAMHEQVERKVLDNINCSLDRRGLDRLNHLPELYRRADSINLLTVPELDHTGPKHHVHYRGYFGTGGSAPQWPEAGKSLPHLFIYLKPFSGLKRLLHALAEMPVTILAVIPGIDEATRQRCNAHEHFHITDRLVDIRAAARQADLALSSGGDTVGLLLLGGTPVCILPYFPEQRLTAYRAVGTGAAISIDTDSKLDSSPGAIVQALTNLLEDRGYTTCAREFAAKYHDLSPSNQVEEVIAEIESVD